MRSPLSRLACLAVLTVACAGPQVVRAEEATWAADPAASQLDARLERARQLLEQGIRFEQGEGLAKDTRQALRLYCAAARAGHADAYIRMGWMYANGTGVIRNDAVARGAFGRAALLGSDIAEQLAQFAGPGPVQLPRCVGGDHAEPESPGEDPGTVAVRPVPQIDGPARFRDTPPPPERRKVVELIVKQARQFRLDPRLVLALVGTESGFDPAARSARNAQGLMQLIPETAERFAVRDMLDPAENLRGGMTYLRWLLAYFKGDVVLAAAAYNAGEGAVDRFRGVPPYAETLAYVQRVRTLYPFDRHPFDPAAASPSTMFNPRSAGPQAARTVKE